MIDFEREERLVLARARGQFSPSLADRARVRSALSSALVSSATPSEVSNGGGPSHASVDSLAADGQLRKWLARLLIPIAATLGAGVGYELGYSAGLERTRGHVTVSDPTDLVQFEGAHPPSAEPLQASSSASPTLAATASALTQPRPARTAPHAPSGPSDTAPVVGLDEEVRLLRRVEQALRADNPRLALGLLDELDRQVPRGQLVEERRAARVMALCRVDVNDAVSAETFANDYPSSAYLARVREVCSSEPARSEP